MESDHAEVDENTNNSSNDQQYELSGARPKDLPDKLQRPKDSSVKYNLAKGIL